FRHKEVDAATWTLSGTSEREKCTLQEAGVFGPQAGGGQVSGEDAVAGDRGVGVLRHERSVAAMDHLVQEGTAIGTERVRVQDDEPIEPLFVEADAIRPGVVSAFLVCPKRADEHAERRLEPGHFLFGRLAEADELVCFPVPDLEWE